MTNKINSVSVLEFSVATFRGDFRVRSWMLDWVPFASNVLGLRAIGFAGKRAVFATGFRRPVIRGAVPSTLVSLPESILAATVGVDSAAAGSVPADAMLLFVGQAVPES